MNLSFFFLNTKIRTKAHKRRKLSCFINVSFFFGFNIRKNQQVEQKHKNNDQKQWRSLDNKTEKKKKKHENDAYYFCCGGL
jgi:hypothetical protein